MYSCFILQNKKINKYRNPFADCLDNGDNLYSAISCVFRWSGKVILIRKIYIFKDTEPLNSFEKKNPKHKLIHYF